MQRDILRPFHLRVSDAFHDETSMVKGLIFEKEISSLFSYMQIIVGIRIKKETFNFQHNIQMVFDRYEPKTVYF